MALCKESPIRNYCQPNSGRNMQHFLTRILGNLSYCLVFRFAIVVFSVSPVSNSSDSTAIKLKWYGKNSYKIIDYFNRQRSKFNRKFFMIIWHRQRQLKNVDSNGMYLIQCIKDNFEIKVNCYLSKCILLFIFSKAFYLMISKHFWMSVLLSIIAENS